MPRRRRRERGWGHMRGTPRVKPSRGPRLGRARVGLLITQSCRRSYRLRRWTRGPLGPLRGGVGQRTLRSPTSGPLPSLQIPGQRLWRPLLIPPVSLRWRWRPIHAAYRRLRPRLRRCRHSGHVQPPHRPPHMPPHRHPHRPPHRHLHRHPHRPSLPRRRRAVRCGACQATLQPPSPRRPARTAGGGVTDPRRRRRPTEPYSAPCRNAASACASEGAGLVPKGLAATLPIGTRPGRWSGRCGSPVTGTEALRGRRRRLSREVNLHNHRLPRRACGRSGLASLQRPRRHPLRRSPFPLWAGMNLACGLRWSG